MDKREFFNEIISYRDKHKVATIRNDVFCCMVETPLFSKEVDGVRICNQGHYTGEANAMNFEFRKDELAKVDRRENGEVVEYIVGFENGNKIELIIA